MSGAERTYLLEAFDSNWIAPVGPDLNAFEDTLGQLTGRAHVAALSSGTAGLHLALLLAGVTSGDEVLVSTFTFVATANAVLQCGATPVFVDSSAADWNIDPDLVAEELAERSKHGRLPAAVVAVDLYGQCADYDRLEPVCAEYEVPLIADSAESLGGSRAGRPAGSRGLLATLSFNGNKIITTGGGGALVADDPALIDRARYLSTQARLPAPHYEHIDAGFNYRLSNVLAAIGRGQLERLPSMMQRRAEIYRRYEDVLGVLPGIDFMPVPEDSQPNRWLTVATSRSSPGGNRSRSDPSRPRSSEHRGQAGMEANAPAAVVRRRRVCWQRCERVCLRVWPVPADWILDVRCAVRPRAGRPSDSHRYNMNRVLCDFVE